MVAFSKITSPLSIQKQAKIAAGNEVRNSIVLVQRRWGACDGWHETLRPETIRGGHAKRMTTGSVNNKRRNGRHSQVDQRRR